MMSDEPSLVMLSPDLPPPGGSVDEYGAQQGAYEQKLKLLDIRAAENAKRITNASHQVGFHPLLPLLQLRESTVIAACLLDSDQPDRFLTLRVLGGTGSGWCDARVGVCPDGKQ